MYSKASRTLAIKMTSKKENYMSYRVLDSSGAEKHGHRTGYRHVCHTIIP